MATDLPDVSHTTSPQAKSPQKIVVGTGNNTWIRSVGSGWDLTRAENTVSSAQSAISIDLNCELVNVKIDPQKTALVVIDMQNIALHKALDPTSTPTMYKAEEAIFRLAVPAARRLGLQIIWLNWGLTGDDLSSLTPAEVRIFAFEPNTEKVDCGLSHRRGDPNDPKTFLNCGERPNVWLR